MIPIMYDTAAGTPDPGDVVTPEGCNTNEGAPNLTGARNMCASNWEVFDMGGNLWEWVVDWIQDNSDVDGASVSTDLYENDAIFGVDEAVATGPRFPAALRRGGVFTGGLDTGVFALSASVAPSFESSLLGFRCGRPN